MAEAKSRQIHPQDLNAKWDACIDLTVHRLVSSSLAGAFAGLLLFPHEQVVAARVRDEEPPKKDKERGRAITLNVEDSDSTSSTDLEEKIGVEGLAMLLRQFEKFMKKRYSKSKQHKPRFNKCNPDFREGVIQCYRCKKYGHMKSDCPDSVEEKLLETNMGHREEIKNRKEKERKSKKKALWAFYDSESSSSSAEEEVNFCLMGRSCTSGEVSAEEESNEVCLHTRTGEGMWYLDSGCSRHMTGDKSMFASLKPKDGGFVTVGDNTRGNIIGIRTISSPTTRWASVAFGAGIGFGSAYIESSYIFSGPPKSPHSDVSVVSSTHEG